MTGTLVPAPTEPHAPAPLPVAGSRTPAIDAHGLVKRFHRPWTWKRIAFFPFELIGWLFTGVPAASPVLQGLTFQVGRGEVVGFLGPNGAGKSTAMKVMTALIRPTAGSARLLGGDARTQARAVFSKTSAWIELPNFYEYMDGLDNLRLLTILHGEVPESALRESLETVGLGAEAGKKVAAYSTGMRQRLALAAAFLFKPDLVLLDEPTSGLDPRGQAEVRELVRTLSRSRHITVFISSHVLHEIEQICDHVVIIDRGRLVTTGAVSELLALEREVYEIEVSDPARAMGMLASAPFVSEVARLEASSGSAVPRIRVVVDIGSGPAVATLLVGAGLSLAALVPIRRSLEEYFLSVTEARG